MVSKPVYREQSEALLSDQGVPSEHRLLVDYAATTGPGKPTSDADTLGFRASDAVPPARLDTSVRTLPPRLPSRNMVLSLA
jgi:hypothetical protein